MAEITLDCYEGKYSSKPSSKITITPRGNGYEWTKSNERGLVSKVYKSSFKLGDLNLVIEGEKGYFSGILHDPFTYTANIFKKDDALKLYDFFAEQMEWSPDALATGTAHPDLLAAKARHSAAGRGGGTRRKRRM